MGAGASASGLELLPFASDYISLETAAQLIGPSFDPSKFTTVSEQSSQVKIGEEEEEVPAIESTGENNNGTLKLSDLFAKYGVELPFGDAITAVMFDSDKSRGRCFVELKDTIRNYSGVLHTLYHKFATTDPTKGMLRKEFCDMLELVENEDLDEGISGGMYEEVTYDEDAEDIEEEDVRMNIGQLAAGLVRVANQLVQMLGADSACEHDAIAGQFKWFIALISRKLGIDEKQLQSAAALSIRGPKFFSFPQNGWKGVPCKCFLQFSIDGEDVGRAVVALDTELTPKTAYNFKCLCTGERGTGALWSKPLHLKGCSIFRAIAKQLIQSGDMVCQDGLGGESIFGGKFEDENKEGCMRHDSPGLLSMANEGTSATNSSQFFITLRPLPDLDGKHVCFGKVVEGLDVVTKISELETDDTEEDNKPKQNVFISDCGVLEN